MQVTLLSPRKSLNKAYLKVKPTRSEIELFKKNLIGLLDGLDESESEEICKELNITSSNYWVLVHRAKLQVRECIEKKWTGNL